MGRKNRRNAGRLDGTQTLYYVLAVVMMVVGIVGTVLPALPGLPLVFAGMLLAAWAGNFEQVGGWTLAALAMLTLLSLGIDFMATMLGRQARGRQQAGPDRRGTRHLRRPGRSASSACSSAPSWAP